MALRRLQAELTDLNRNPLENVSVGPSDDSNILHWKGHILGPSNSPYKGGIFKIDIQFNTDYPFKPPKVKFTTKIYHPNIDEEGAICVALLKNDQWKPATRVNQVLRALVTLLEQPNPEDPLMTDIAEIYVTDQAKFQKTAKDYTKRYASS
ncbi:ubiquitin-conjugating enzyme/RWD-like protein [Lobosporangium transversale]|uniref:E2 ubiquitin-conjugating enzyme n=1 Tax=Lobosporangium transversale TaxID=64571 RepID=A0A1Y2G526_9FUNG|nr:ubiquitin-conjugating enzyme/RWD-like protein [Lobosporangium transversale]ORY93706.1 ubiquitin-conjugating enzyme/RWD-like protein [Lobosporangium transversale]|eukprot:XP_021875201.1 ubiquitin-conjugating enzyme/RWD-like protein [Lobosporangium transversale]